jgi:hypothetical protein
MKTIEITAHITLTASTAVIDSYLAEVREAEEEATLRAWLADPANWDDPIYSDIYKDVHGVRPRW